MHQQMGIKGDCAVCKNPVFETDERTQTESGAYVHKNCWHQHIQDIMGPREPPRAAGCSMHNLARISELEAEVLRLQSYVLQVTSSQIKELAQIRVLLDATLIEAQQDDEVRQNEAVLTWLAGIHPHHGGPRADVAIGTSIPLLKTEIPDWSMARTGAESAMAIQELQSVVGEKDIAQHPRDPPVGSRDTAALRQVLSTSAARRGEHDTEVTAVTAAPTAMHIKARADDVGLSDRVNNRLPPHKAQNVLSMLEEHLITAETINAGLYREELEDIGIRDAQCDALLLDDEAWERKYSVEHAVAVGTYGPEDSDAMHSVHLAIVADPEGFFGLGAAENGDLSLVEFTRACRVYAKGISQGAVQSMFRKLDTDNNGNISVTELRQTTETARLFYKQSNCESVVIASLIELVHEIRSQRVSRSTGVDGLGDQEQVLADMMALAELSEDLLRNALSDKAVKALMKQGEEVLEQLGRMENGGKLQEDQGLGKFVTATYGMVSDYYRGLDAIGTPHPNILEHMKKETTNSPDSYDIFDAWNSGFIQTTPVKEWDLICEPFKPESVSKDISPRSWVLKHAYGGKRFPIRLQVFLHALSATQMSSGIRFGDYKKANELPETDARWLHQDEVSMVKVVLLRFVKAQLDGVSLTNALAKHGALRGKYHAEKANIKADRIVEALAKLLAEKDGSDSACNYDVLVHELKGVATEAEIEAVIDHFHKKLEEVQVSEADAIGLRVYTGPLYVKINSSLRQVGCHVKMVISLACPLEQCTPGVKQTFKEAVAAVAQVEPKVVSMDFRFECPTSTQIELRVSVAPKKQQADEVRKRLTVSAIKVELSQEISNISVIESAAVVALYDHLKSNHYVNIIYACSSGMRKISRASRVPRGHVYRGVGGVRLSTEFLNEKEGGGRGGVEFAFMSTTTKKELAVSYIGGKAFAVIFECELGDIDRGCSLSFISQFPGEDEVLIPAMSYLEITGKPYIMVTDDIFVTVYPASINCNQQSQTIEQIESRRKRDLLALTSYIDNEIKRDLPLIVELLREELAEKKVQELNLLYKEVLDDFVRKRKDWEECDAKEFNHDSRYKDEMVSAIDFKHNSIVKLGNLVYAKDNLTKENFVIVATKKGKANFAEVLLSLGFELHPAGKPDLQDDRGETLLALACKMGNLKVCESLLNAGADIKSIRHDSASALSLAIVNGNTKILNILPKMIEYAEIVDRHSYLRHLSLAFLQTHNICRWLREGWPLCGLIGIIVSLLLSPDVEPSIQDRLSHVRAFLHHHSTILQDPLQWPVAHVLEQLAFQESLVVFDGGAEGMLDAASRQRQGATVSADVSSISPAPLLISWVNMPPLQHPCRWLMQGGPVKSIAYSPDGSRLARAEKCEVVVCKTVSGFDVSILRGHTDNVTSVAWCSHGTVGTKIATSSEDKTIKIWLEQSDGAFVCQSTFEGHSDTVWSVKFSPDGSSLLSGSRDNTSRLMSIKTRQEIASQNHSCSILAVTFFPDGNTFACAGGDSTIRVWCAHSLKEILTLKGHSDLVRSICCSPNGTTLVSGSYDKTLKVWVVDTGQELWTLKGHGHWVVSVAFSPDGKILASGSRDNTVRLWDAHSYNQISTLYEHRYWKNYEGIIHMQKSRVTHVDFLDTETLASGSLDGTTRVWNIAAIMQTGEFEMKNSTSSKARLEFTHQTVGEVVSQYVITVKRELLLFYQGQEVVAFFRAPNEITSIQCFGDRVVAGHMNGKEIHLRLSRDGRLVESCKCVKDSDL